MIITQLHLQHIGRHEKLTFECAEPVVGLLGENGVGKSTVLDMLEYLLTGETRDPIASYVRHHEGKGVASATFIKGGKKGYIMRSFGKSNTRKLAWDGKELTRAAEVDAAMREIFAADKKAIANAVFVNQGSLEKILFSEKQSDRQNMFIKLVNMSFCSQRVEVLTGKLRKLEATIVDLGPAMDAAKIVLEDSRKAYEQAAQVYNAMPDHTIAIAFCEDFIRTEEALKATIADIARLQNEMALHFGSLQELLKKWGMTQYDQAKQHMLALETQHQEWRQKLVDFNTVKSGLSHYNRISQEITGLNVRLGGLLEQQKQENPDQLPEEQIQTKLVQVQSDVRLREEYNRQEQVLIGKSHQMTAKQQELAAVPAPAHTYEQLHEIFQQIQRVSGLLQMVKQHQTMQKEILGCVGENRNGGAVECPKCGLHVSNPQQLTPEGQKQMEDLIARTEADYKQLHEGYIVAEKEFRDHEALTQRLAREIQTLNGEITEGEKVQATFKFTNTLEEDQACLNRFVQMSIRVPELKKSISAVQQDMMPKIKAKKEMVWVEQWLSRQHEFSDAAELTLKEAAAKADQDIALRRREFEEMTRLNTLVVNTKTLTATAQGDQAKWTEFLQKPMPVTVSTMSAQLQGNIPAVKQELTAHQDARQRAYGRVEEANSGYVRAQNQLGELERRAAEDKEKRRIVEDLHALRALFEDDALPMDVVKYHFVYLARLTQAYLTQLDANFSIELDPDDPLGFKFRRLDEPPHEPLPMMKLSGGQRVRLCTAFLIAVQQRLVREVGLLVLDEPSVHLADTGVEALKQFLISLSEKLRNSEMQVWVVDHRTELRAGLNQVLELK